MSELVPSEYWSLKQNYRKIRMTENNCKNKETKALSFGFTKGGIARAVEGFSWWQLMAKYLFFIEFYFKLNFKYSEFLIQLWDRDDLASKGLSKHQFFSSRTSEWNKWPPGNNAR